MKKAILNVKPESQDNFIKSGGDSLKAVLFIDKLELELTKFNRNKLKTNLALDVLLNQTFSDLICLLEKDILYGKVEPLVEFKNLDNKRIRLDNESVSDVLYFISKSNNNQFIGNKRFFLTSEIDLSIKLSWKVDTSKCVDATPLFVALKDGRELILIGSHSKMFMCVDAKKSEIIWTFHAQDRIESSACLSKCGKFVVFGKFNY